MASRALDLQTGGGEVLAGIPKPPPVLVATEGWAPNAALARQRLALLGGVVVEVGENADLPFADNSFDLVVSRHPVTVRWDEVARVLSPGGAYLSQQVGAGSVRELTDFIMGPQPVSRARHPDRAGAAATVAGLTVVDLRAEALRMELFDVAAVIVFLRKVIWTVPGFTVDGYRDRACRRYRSPQRSHASAPSPPPRQQRQAAQLHKTHAHNPRVNRAPRHARHPPDPRWG